MGQIRNAHKILVGKPEVKKKTRQRHNHTRQNTIKIYLKGIGYEVVE
jgi:flagellar biosynthesis protein FlhB